MISPFGSMYLRPGNLWKNFEVWSLHTYVKDGSLEEEYNGTGECFRGILAEADSSLSDRMKHRWDQEQHSLTHTLLVRGSPNVKKGDLLVMEERAFFVLVVDDLGALRVSGMIYVEERNDLK